MSRVFLGLIIGKYIETQIRNHNFNLDSIEGVIVKHLVLLPEPKMEMLL